MKFSTLLLIIIILLGLWFRFYGITDNHSFWSDEAFVSSFARDIARGQKDILAGIKSVSYQPIQILMTAIVFKLFGTSEFAARLTSVFFGTLGIVFAFLIAKRLSNWGGGLLAAFLYSFSQLNLANSTQAKPYAALETFLLIIIYLLLKKKPPHIFIFSIITFATFVHYIAVTFFIIYIVFLIIEHHKFIIKAILKPFSFILLTIGVIAFIYIFRILPTISFIFKPTNINNTIYLKNLVLRQYGIFFLLGLVGLIISYKKARGLIFGILIWIFSLLLLWNFRNYSHNIRYLVPFFGAIFTFFAVFWGWVGELIILNFKFQISTLLPILVIITLYITNYKIVRLPQSYYSPNADFYGDVQAADYKTTYALIEKKFSHLNQIVVFNDLIDTQRWYLDKQADAYFMKGFADNKPVIHPVDGKIIYRTIDQFLIEKNKYPKGLLIVEDWESFLPEDIKQYAKKNMKLEFRVESLPQAKNDPWPIEVYSWGME